MSIKLKRIEREIKQGEFAKMIGITPAYLRRIEKGEVDLKISLMKKISKILQVSVQELFFNEIM